MKLVTEQGHSIAEAAFNLGVNANLLGRWEEETEHPDDSATPPGNMAAMQAELKRLRKKTAQNGAQDIKRTISIPRPPLGKETLKSYIIEIYSRRKDHQFFDDIVNLLKNMVQRVLQT